jgi:hypothetical protein
MKDLSEVRTKRNAWLHSLKGITDIDCQLSINNANKLFSLVSGIDIQTNLTRVIPGTGGIHAELYSRAAN